jgi:beta-glucanase (GH16 family)
LGERFSDRWHVIGFDWSDDLVWYLDGREVHRVDPDTLDVANDPFAPDARPVTQVKLNLALGGNWPGPLGPTTVDEAGTTSFLVDYVRIYDLG